MSNKVTPAANENLFQSHGSRIEAFFNLDGFVERILQPMINASTLHKETDAVVVFEEGNSEQTHVFGLLFGTPDLGFLSLLATNERRKTNDVLAVYPVVSGKRQSVQIQEVLVWDNQLCATVKGSVNGFDVAFFATDFFYNSDKYLENETLDIDLALLACMAEEAEKGFSFEGQQAVDWLAKLGEEPNYDEDGTVQPVQFNMENFAAYLATEPKAPNEAQFQSPAGDVEEVSFVGLDYYKSIVTIRGEDAEFEVPILLKKEFFPVLKKGMPIRGYSSMIGRIAL